MICIYEFKYKVGLTKFGLLITSAEIYPFVDNVKVPLEESAPNDLRICNDTNWLYNIKVNEWLLDHSPRSDDSTYSIYLFYIVSYGYIACRYSTYAWSKLNVRPTLYLKTDVKITGGDGTSTNPYILGL